MTCADAQAELTAFLDGELTGDAAAAVNQHLAACAACARTRDALAAATHLADVWQVQGADIQSAVLTQIALEDMASEMARLRAEVETLRAEVAALRRPVSAPGLLFPYAPPISAPLHIV